MASKKPKFGDSRLPPRFWSKCRLAESGCWLWIAGKTKGYGAFSFNGKPITAHRASYIKLVGKILGHLEIDHLCRTPACVNPSHLELVTSKENTLRGNGITAVCARKTHCPKGHLYSGENLYIAPAGDRRCYICQRENNNRRRA